MHNYINTQFGSYRAVKLISSIGGFGSVYLGKHPVLNDRSDVAIKVLHDHQLNEKNKKLFLQEALLLNQLKHPHILPLIDANLTEHGVPYLITPYAPGGSLRDRLQRQVHGPLSQEEVMAILVQIGQALCYAHRHKIVHRDLKPENILFKNEQEVLLADFGIAILLEEGTTKMHTGEAIGTPKYMAPEQFHKVKSTKIDQYAFGCIAYELFTGATPFASHPKSLLQWALAHEQEMPTPPRKHNPYLSPQREYALLRAMHKHREQRYESIADFLIALGASADLFEEYQDVLDENLAIEPPPDSNTVNSLSPTQMQLNQWLEEGKAHFNAKRYEDAMQKCDQVTRYLSSSVEAYYLMGEALRQLERPWEAIAAYKQVLHYDPKYAHAYIGIGEIYASSTFNQLEEALDKFQEAIRVAPKDAMGYYKIGVTLERLKRPNEALPAYESALLFNPENLQIHYRKAALLEKLKRYQEAIQTYESIITRAPQSLNAYYRKIDLLQHLGQYNHALIGFDEIIKQIPGLPEPYFKKINLLLACGKEEEALSVYDQLLSSFPDDVDTYYKKISLLQRLRQYSHALETYNQIIRRFPDDIHHYRQKLHFLLRFQKHDAAIETYNQMLMRFPHQSELYTEKIELLTSLQRYDEAIATYNQCIMRWPDKLDNYYKKIALLEHIERFDDVLMTYDQILQRVPGDIEVYDKKIKLLLSLQREQEALSTYDQIIARFPNILRTYYRKVALLIYQRDYDNAFSTYDQIIARFPQEIKAYYKKVELFRELQRYEEAIIFHNRIIQLTPDNANAYQSKGQTLKEYGDNECLQHFTTEEWFPAWLNPLWRRFAPNKHYLAALSAYQAAYRRSPTTSNALSIGNILHLLGKEGEAQKKRDQANNISATASNRLLKFLGTYWYWLPFAVNTIGTLIVFVFFTSPWLLACGLLLHVSLGLGVQFLLRKINKPYQLYNAWWLVLLGLSASLSMVFLALTKGATIALLLVILLFLLIINSLFYLSIDIWGIPTVIQLVYRGLGLIIQGFIQLKGFAENKYYEYQQQSQEKVVKEIPETEEQQNQQSSRR